MIRNVRFYIIYILLLITGLYLNLHSDISVPMNKSFNEFPTHNKEWEMVSESKFDGDVLEKLRPTDYMLRKYIGPMKSRVYLYIGYHAGGEESGEIHSPKHCLPGSGWHTLTEDKMSIDGGLREINLVKAVYQKGEEKELFFYWYDIKGRTLSDEFALKIAEIKNSILYRRKDAAFIRISVPCDSDEEQAYNAGIKFIRDFYPVINEFLPE